jgi:hypothetical protein
LNSRDRTRYRYFTIGIDRGSKLIKCLEEDAKELGGKSLAKVIVARLGDYYQFVSKMGEGTFIPTASIGEDKDASKNNAAEAASVWKMDN